MPTLGDRKPGSAVHGLRPEEGTAILEPFEQFSGQVSVFAFSLPGFADGAWTHRPARGCVSVIHEAARNQWTNRPGELPFAEESGLCCCAGGDDGAPAVLGARRQSGDVSRDVSAF